MKNKKIVSPKNVALDAYEQELENSLDLTTLEKGNLSQQDRMDWADAARRHIELQKSRRITLSVNVEELLKFKSKAEEKGIPYQTLMSIMMKQYNDGEIKVGL